MRLKFPEQVFPLGSGAIEVRHGVSAIRVATVVQLQLQLRSHIALLGLWRSCRATTRLAGGGAAHNHVCRFRHRFSVALN